MRPNKKQICQLDLVQRILTMDIGPGSVLDETLLSEQYDLSRTPLREVFQKLAGEGFLDLEENRGAKVSSMDLESMRKFFQSAPMIYSAIAQLACENASSDQIAKLKSVQHTFRGNAEVGDVHAMAVQNHSFHKIIGEMASNPYLSPSLNRLLIDHTRMSQKFYRPSNSSERKKIWLACDQHDQMIEAIEKRAPSLAIQLTLDHWALSRDHIAKYVQTDPLEIDLDIGDENEGRKHAV